MSRFDRLGNVTHSRQHSLDVVLPVEAMAQPEGGAGGGGWEESPADDGAAASPPPSHSHSHSHSHQQEAAGTGTGSFFFEHNDLELTEEETLVEMMQRERRDWHNERTKLVHCVHIQQLELMQRAAASHERAGEIAKEFARTIDKFEERLYNVEANVQKEIIAIKILAENLRGSTSSSSVSMESRMTHMEKGIDTIIEKLNSTNIGAGQQNRA
jgi:hypothetical protein